MPEVHETQTVEVYIWSPPGEDGLLTKLGVKTVGDVLDEVVAIVGEYGPGHDEYFMTIPGLSSRDQPWPEGDIVCFSANGSSEGDYVHVEVHNFQKRQLVLLAKTFDGRDASWAFARLLADLLEVQ